MRPLSLKKLVKIFTWFISIIIVLLFLVFLAFQLSPKPGALIINRMFSGKVEIQDQEKYNTAAKTVATIKDVTYKSTFKRNQLDIYFPKDTSKRVPVLFWVHGGGYIGGDKAGLKEFVTYIADTNKVAVVAVNYEPAPSLHYPGQVEQLDDAYTFLNAQKQKYPQLNFDNVLFGGDSAGSQIAAQYVAIQTNNAYAKEMKMKQTINKQNISGFISYCGPLDLQQVASLKSDNQFMKFFVKTVAWSLLGDKNWKDNPKLEQASIAQHLTSDFPPSYITDGNAYSFQDQGIAFVEKLQALNIPVDSLFYKGTAKEISHEYQFNYKTKEAQDCLQQTTNAISEFLTIYQDKQK
ncbi:alpha/beta hydrolase fold domain-containing protein [Erwinia sp. CPCC 100877]|nr:alpha/beta hydrolase fold domain-containing protein [Erwinia sp. CPCC 100877]